MSGTRQGWINVASLFIILVILFGGGFLTFGVFFDPLLRQFHTSHALTAALLTSFFVTMALSEPLVGWLLERIEARFTITAGAVIAVIAYVMASRADSYALMLGAYLLLGVGIGFSIFVPVSVVVPDWFGERRGLAYGITISGAALGGVAMPELASHMITAYGWRAAYLSLALPALVIAIPLALIFVRNRPSRGRHHGNERAPGLETRAALTSATVWLIIAGYFLYAFTVSIALAHLIPYLIGAGFTPHNAASIFGIMQAVAVIGCIVMGVIGDWISARAAIIFTMLLLLVSYLALLGVHHTALLALFIIAFGFNVAAPTALFMMLLAEAIGLRNYAFISGIATFALTMGDASGPLAAGRIFDVSGGYAWALAMGAGVALLAAIIAAVLPRLEFAAANKSGEPVFGREIEA
ncbi:MAG: MFS transporter [Candidatus Binataceae bacterium]